MIKKALKQMLSLPGLSGESITVFQRKPMNQAYESTFSRGHLDISCAPCFLAYVEQSTSLMTLLNTLHVREAFIASIPQGGFIPHVAGMKGAKRASSHKSARITARSCGARAKCLYLEKPLSPASFKLLQILIA